MSSSCLRLSFVDISYMYRVPYRVPYCNSSSNNLSQKLVNTRKHPYCPECSNSLERSNSLEQRFCFSWYRLDHPEKYIYSSSKVPKSSSSKYLEKINLILKSKSLACNTPVAFLACCRHYNVALINAQLVSGLLFLSPLSRRIHQCYCFSRYIGEFTLKTIYVYFIQ